MGGSSKDDIACSDPISMSEAETGRLAVDGSQKKLVKGGAFLAKRM